MNLLKKILCLDTTDSSAIGLCRFNDDFMKLEDTKEVIKKRIKKDPTLTQMLKRSI